MRDFSKFIFSKETPKGAWLIQFPSRIEVGANKRDYEYMGLQLFLASPFIFYFVYFLIKFDGVHLFFSSMLLSVFVFWIGSNLFGKIKIEITESDITVFDGLNSRKLICKIPVTAITKVELGSKAISKEYMGKAGVRSLNAKKVEIEIKTKNKISYFFADTTKNIYKSYFKYILNEYLKQKENY